jgi:glycosyltransferase involved in cell wall biosynthesis
VRIIGDGVDLSLFQGSDAVRNENILVWTSNPDRGTALAAKIFAEYILPKWPDLELHIYGRAAVYGWPPESEGPYLPREEHMTNVFIHEPLTKAGLAKVLRESWALFYPTYWPETYCIAALEAQAAGTPVVASPYGALIETVQGGVLSYDFPNAISQLRNKNRWEKLSQAGKEFAATRDWDLVADDWITVMEEELANGQPAQATSA